MGRVYFLLRASGILFAKAISFITDNAVLPEEFKKRINSKQQKTKKSHTQNQQEQEFHHFHDVPSKTKNSIYKLKQDNYRSKQIRSFGVLKCN